MLSEARPSSTRTSPRPLRHACAELEAADAHTIPEVKDMVRELSAIHQEFSTDSPVVAQRSAVTERMRALSEAADVPLVMDTILDCDVQIPEQVAREARDAVRVLYRLSPYPLGYPAWRDYHTRFRLMCCGGVQAAAFENCAPGPQGGQRGLEVVHLDREQEVLPARSAA